MVCACLAAVRSTYLVAHWRCVCVCENKERERVVEGWLEREGRVLSRRECVREREKKEV